MTYFESVAPVWSKNLSFIYKCMMFRKKLNFVGDTDGSV